MDSKVAIIVLNYNNADDTINCLKNLRNLEYPNYEVIIVDNHSNDDSVKKILNEKNDDEILIESQVNQGYAAGNNLGMKSASADVDYFCILNNDVEVANNFLNILVATMNKNPKLGITGPLVCEFDQRNIVQAAGSIVDMNFGRATELYKGQEADSIKQNIITCDYVGGACMLISAHLVAEIGGIPDNYFLFYEENEWCAKVKAKGLEVACVTAARVWHQGSHTINKIGGLSEYFMYRNLVIFINRNGSFKNKLIFYPYFFAFCLKALFTKKNGKRFFGYFIDGILDRNRYLYLQK